MKIKISQRQQSKNFYSKRTLNRFKEYARLCVSYYKEYFNKVNCLEIVVVDSADKVVYGDKSKPMMGFDSLYDNKTKRAKIYIYRIEGYSETFARMAHEIVHVKQVLSGEMKTVNGGEEIYWKGRKCHAWKKINWSEYDKAANFDDYARKLPWEVEVNYGPLRRLDLQTMRLFTQILNE